MKTLDRQRLNIVRKKQSNSENFRGWRGQFTPLPQLANPRGFYRVIIPAITQ